jgi:hypothetical protein
LYSKVASSSHLSSPESVFIKFDVSHDRIYAVLSFGACCRLPAAGVVQDFPRRRPGLLKFHVDVTSLTGLVGLCPGFICFGVFKLAPSPSSIPSHTAPPHSSHPSHSTSSLFFITVIPFRVSGFSGLAIWCRRCWFAVGLRSSTRTNLKKMISVPIYFSFIFFLSFFIFVFFFFFTND